MTSTTLKSYRGIPYEVAKKKQEAILNAIDAVLLGQSYQIGTRQLKRADLSALQDALDYWSNIVSKCESGVAGIKVQRAIPQDF